MNRSNRQPQNSVLGMSVWRLFSPRRISESKGGKVEIFLSAAIRRTKKYYLTLAWRKAVLVFGVRHAEHGSAEPK